MHIIFLSTVTRPKKTSLQGELLVLVLVLATRNILTMGHCNIIIPHVSLLSFSRINHIQQRYVGPTIANVGPINRPISL